MNDQPQIDVTKLTIEELGIHEAKLLNAIGETLKVQAAALTAVHKIRAEMAKRHTLEMAPNIIRPKFAT